MPSPRSLLAALVGVLVLAVAAAAAPGTAQARKRHRHLDQAPAPASPFVWRGIIEGFYGKPWSHGDRMRIIRWMGDHGFNAYVHAPKGDVWQTTAWRQPYPAEVQANYDEEIAAAAERGIQWIPNLSPGRARPRQRICFSCPGDLEVALAKLQPFLAAGAHTVMVSFDDIPPQLGAADAAAYGARFPGTPPEYQFGRATTEFLNALLTRLPPGDTLLTVLPDYAGTTDSPFLQAVRDGALNPAIGVMWTGPHIRASRFHAADAAAYAQLIGRIPIVWENWVARDFVPSRLFLGPFNSRTEVVGSVQGFFFNPMNEPDLNMLPLATAGDWMQDPEGYSKRRSWRAAVHELTRGRRASKAFRQLRAFAETSYSSGLLRNESPTAARLQEEFLTAYGRGARWMDPAEALQEELELVRGAPRALRRLRNRHFAREAEPFLTAASHLATTGQHGLALLGAERPSLTLERTKEGFEGRALPPDPGEVADLRAEVGAEWATARTSTLFTYGCRVVTRGCGSRPFNRMDDFLTKVMAIDAEWAPEASLAGRRLRLTMGDERVRRKRDGRFTLPPGSCGARVLATDGAGGQTSLPLPRCPRRKHDDKDRERGKPQDDRQDGSGEDTKPGDEERTDAGSRTGGTAAGRRG